MKRFQYKGERVVRSGYGSGTDDQSWQDVDDILFDSSGSDWGWAGRSLSQSGDAIGDHCDYYSFQEQFDHYSLPESGDDGDYPPGSSVSLPGEWPD